MPVGQKKILFIIAQEKIQKLSSKETMLLLKMTSSSIITALQGLEEKDIIEKEQQQYKIINPVIKYYVLQA
ncbi:MAG: hypothetical protein KIT27_11490 [Legionellales bacterium]|nr:hypothetical protein [Legionellales bacterium]